MRYAGSLGFGDIRAKIDQKQAYATMIAVHSKRARPCNYMPRQHYSSANLAMKIYCVWRSV